MKKDPLIYLDHILSCVQKIKSYTLNLTETDFLQNALIQDAVIRNLEIIGEATKSFRLNFANSTHKLNGRRLPE